MMPVIRMMTALGLSLLGLSVVSAQNNVDSALLILVSQAVDQTRAVNSLRVETQTRIEISGMPQGMSFGQQETSAFALVRAADGWDASGSRTTSVTLPNGAVEFTTETVLLDGTLYLRVGEMPALGGAGMTPPGGQAPAETPQLPEGWFDASALLAEGDGLAGGIGLGAALESDNLLGTLALPVDIASVTALAELQPTTINGQTMRVFQLTLDAQAVLDSEAAGLLNADFGGDMAGGFPGGGFPGGAGQPPMTPPAEMPALPEGTPQPPDPASIQVTFAVYVGEDDGYVHRIYSVIALAQSDPAQPGLLITMLTDFSSFNQVDAIMMPQIGS